MKEWAAIICIFSCIASFINQWFLVVALFTMWPAVSLLSEIVFESWNDVEDEE